MCKWGTLQRVRVKIPGNLSATSKARWKLAKIDRCIAPLVSALQRGGIDMRGSCCGHGNGEGHIDLQDGRGLIVLSRAENRRYVLRGRRHRRTKTRG